jgi:fatty acid desaturase
VHHLYPGVPFYRYATVWHARVKAMRDAYFATGGAGVAAHDDDDDAAFSAGRAGA